MPVVSKIDCSLLCVLANKMQHYLDPGQNDVGMLLA